ncbi:fluconazole resistance protein 1 [Niveomyces insectorum RCEF 264]|uniref:Fluconazole resistance protein 1 n=1 Tax=Niveomyces insectorum RCEF 264 TaxID=1081102 RepID=A0A167NI56_9HYPO|nr:fluconazole resistance protein 1 [Niveomyces insectorum RCEF 264]
MASTPSPPRPASASPPASAASAASPASSVTATEPVASASDLEAAQPKPTRVTHWQLILDPAGVTPEVLAYEYPGEGTNASPYVVSFLPVDGHNPQQFSKLRKWSCTLAMAFAALAISFVSTAYSGGLEEMAETFHISEEVAITGISLFVLGFAVGPLIWAPSSEFFGRQILFIITYIALTCFNVGVSLAQNIQTLVIMRFFAGAFGSSPLTNAGGVIADMFQASERGLGMAVFASAPFLGPSLGPIVAGFLGQAEGWRWVERVMSIFTFVMLLLGGLVVPETYAPVLLRKRAAVLSKKTGKVYVSRLDMHHHKNGVLARPSMASEFRTALLRPWILLFREPIVLAVSLYMAIIYGTLYMMFPAFPIVFQAARGWSPGIGGLAFLGIAVGMTVSVVGAMLDNTRYINVAKSYPGGAAPPEARLPSAALGSVLLPIGLFWFAWTNEEPVHWIVPIIASGFFAAGIVLLFLSLMNYLIDSYVVFAASVLAASTVLRSLFGAAFPLFTTYMYNNLGFHWASSVPAFLALACVPCPFLLIRYGESIRMRCKYAAEAANVLKRMRAGQQEAAEMDEEEAAEEADEVEAEERFERALERKATQTEGQRVASGEHTGGGVLSGDVSDGPAAGEGSESDEKEKKI